MKTLLLLLTACALSANPAFDYQSKQKIAVQNSILAKVNGQTISMMDVKKKMDFVFHQNYPQLASSSQARLQFYETSWKHVLREMIDQELIISDALDREIKLTDADVRETLEERFGPNVMQTLDNVGLTYDEAWKMVKNELIVQRMNWWFIHSKAMSSVTPQDIRKAYRTYLEEHPAYTEWKYRVISIRMDQEDSEKVKTVHDALAGKKWDEVEGIVETFKSSDAAISLSNEFVAKTQDLSDLHKNALSHLTPGCFSEPAYQYSRVDKKNVYRIFYLNEKSDVPAPAFEDLALQLKNGLVQEAVVQESNSYLSKLRKHYGFDGNQALPEDLHPFSIQ